MRDRVDAPRDFRRRLFDIDGFPVETNIDQKQVSNARQLFDMTEQC